MIQTQRLLTAEGFNQRLREAVLFERLRDPQSRLAPSEGWSSNKRFFTAEVAAIIEKAKQLSERVTDNVEVWANVTRNGEAVAAHDHIYSTGRKYLNKISGVYYPQDSEAAICFPDLGLRIPISEGLLLLFAPEQMHSVEPAHSERISIAFNAY